MSKYFDEINGLVLSGDVDKALLKLIDFAKLNEIDCSDAVALKAQYAILDKKIQQGVIENDLNKNLNRIIHSVIECIREIKSKFFNKNRWVSSQIEFFKEEIFSHAKEILVEDLQNTDINWFFDDQMIFEIIENKIDENHWYVIHWKVVVYNPIISVLLFTPDGMFVKRRDQDEQIKLDDFSLKKALRECLVNTFNFFGAPVFDVEMFSDEIYDKGYGLFLEFSSVSYPNKIERPYYRWKKNILT